MFLFVLGAAVLAQVTALDKKIEDAENLVKDLNVKSDVDIR